MSKKPLNSSLLELAKKRAKSAKTVLVKTELQKNSEIIKKIPVFRSLAGFPQYAYEGKTRGGAKPCKPELRYWQEFPWTASIKSCLDSVFGHSQFTLMQEQIINSALLGDDIIVILPTGSGKSLTYQLPALLSKGLTVIVQPLISLMQDQVSKMTALQIKTIQFNSNLTALQQENELREVELDHEIKMLFTSPEMLSKSGKFMDTLERLYKNQRIARLVIDEAHCICQWGHDFRPDYMKISKFRLKFPKVPIMALSASSTQDMIQYISENLLLKDPVLFNHGYNRSNLYYEVRNKSNLINSEIGKFIIQNHENDSGLIYCNFIKDCEILTKVLKYTYKLKIAAYYGDMTTEKKNEIYTKWINGEINIIVGTLAFGLGIDKPNVRFVIHYSIPESLELYYQETGRAGRDGVSSNCLLFYKYDDKAKIEALNKYKKSDCYKMIEYCENYFSCRRKMMIEFFGESFNAEDCRKMCDNCRNPKELIEVDISKQALVVIKDLARRTFNFNTLTKIIEVIRGSLSRNTRELADLPSFGLFKDWNNKNLERIIRKMIYKEVLVEVPIKTQYGSYYQIEVGPKAKDVASGNLVLKMFLNKGDKFTNEDQNKEGKETKKEIQLLEDLQKNFSVKFDDLDLGVDFFSDLNQDESRQGAEGIESGIKNFEGRVNLDERIVKIGNEAGEIVESEFSKRKIEYFGKAHKLIKK